MENITHRGTWFLPENPDNKIVGTLTFSSDEGIDLELDGSFVNDFLGELIRPDFILGKTYQGKFITIYRCNQYQDTSTSSKFSAIYLLEGDHFFSEDELVFHRSLSSFYNLGLWLWKRGFSTEDNLEEISSSITYTRPPSIPFALDGIEGAFCFDVQRSSPSDAVFETELIKQRTVVRLQYEQVQPLHRILKDIRHFQNFLTLAIYEPTYPNHVRLQNDQRTRKIGSKDHPKTINLYFAPPYFKSVKSKHHYIFKYRDIEENFPTIIRKWYALNEIIDDPFYLLFNSFYNTTNAMESRFLDLARAIETFHRRLRHNEERPPQEHKQMIKNIIDKVDESDKTWLKQRLAFSNEPTLHKRLEEVIEEIKSPFVDRVIPDYAQFAKDIKNTRNFYTHFGQKLEKKAKKGEELFMLTKRLKLILVAIILQEIGFAKEQVSELLQRNQHRLFYYLITKE